MSVLGPIYSGANTIFIPPLLSRNHPAAWLQVITKHKGRVYGKYTGNYGEYTGEYGNSTGKYGKYAVQGNVHNK